MNITASTLSWREGKFLASSGVAKKCCIRQDYIIQRAGLWGMFFPSCLACRSRSRSRSLSQLSAPRALSWAAGSCEGKRSSLRFATRCSCVPTCASSVLLSWLWGVGEEFSQLASETKSGHKPYSYAPPAALALLQIVRAARLSSSDCTVGTITTTVCGVQHGTFSSILRRKRRWSQFT